MGQAGDLGGAAGATDDVVADSAAALTRAQKARQGIGPAVRELFSSHTEAASDAVGTAVQRPVQLASTAKDHVVRVKNEATSRAQGAWGILRNGQGGAPDQLPAGEAPAAGQIHLVPKSAPAAPSPSTPSAFDQALKEVTGSKKPGIPTPLEVKAEINGAANTVPTGTTSSALGQGRFVSSSTTTSGLNATTAPLQTPTPVASAPTVAPTAPKLTMGERFTNLFKRAAPAEARTAEVVAGETALVEGGAAAAAATAGAATATVAGTSVLRVAAGATARFAARRALGGAIGMLDGAMEVADGVQTHNSRETKTGVLSMGLGGVGGVVGGLVGGVALSWIPFVGLAVGGLGGAYAGGKAGDWLAKKIAGGIYGTEDAVTNTLNAGKAKIDEVKNKAKYAELVVDYQKILNAPSTANFQDAQALVNKAAEADEAVKNQIIAMRAANQITKEQGETEIHNADNEFGKFRARLQAGLGATVTTPSPSGKPNPGKPVDGIGQNGSASSTTNGSTPSTGGAAAASTGAIHSDGFNDAQIEYLKKIQRSLGLTGGDVDGKIGHQTRDLMIKAHLISEGELQLADSKHAYASLEALRPIFNKHDAAIQAYVAAHTDGGAAQGTGEPAPAGPTTAPSGNETSTGQQGVPSTTSQPSAPTDPLHELDSRMQTALASLSKQDLQHMHPAKGPLHIGALVGDRKFVPLGMEVENNGRIQTYTGDTPTSANGPAFDINITGQRYTVTAADGTDVTSKAPLLSAEAIQQAAREHVASIHVQEVGEGSNSFVFTPSKFAAAVKER